MYVITEERKWILDISNKFNRTMSYLAWAFIASLRAASVKRWMSTSSTGSCTYRTTDPRIKQFFTDNYNLIYN